MAIAAHPDHPNHRLISFHGGQWCEQCKTGVFRPVDMCYGCGGIGIKYRDKMTGRGRAYRCGECKGTGKVAPTKCQYCREPIAAIRTSRFQPDYVIVPCCESCYKLKEKSGQE